MKIHVWIKESDLDRVAKIENGESINYSKISMWTTKWEVAYQIINILISYDTYMKIKDEN